MNLFHFIFRRVYIRFDYLCLIFETLNIKITTLMLQKTFLARCDNRACLAKTNIMSGHRRLGCLMIYYPSLIRLV